jgi:deoxyhypusine monooxygenase
MEEFFSITPENILLLGSKITNTKIPLTERTRALFTLKSIGSDEAVDSMKDGLLDESVLLAHEVAYCLGQTRNPHAIPSLSMALRNEKLDSMVRHEAAEALGAIGDASSIEVLKEFTNHPLPEISETCEVAIDLIEWRLNNKEVPEDEEDIYQSVDPAPPSKKKSVAELKEELNNHNLRIFQRYRALFKLRNLGTEEAVLAISSALYDDDNGALFSHEVAFVLGQLRHPAAINGLKHALENVKNHDMVRHEASEALGNIDSVDTKPILESFLNDNIKVVKESVEVALDIFHYNASNEFQYADGIVKNDV